MGAVGGGAAQDDLHGPAGDLEQHPEQAESGEQRAQLVGLRDAQRRGARSEEQPEGENERDRLRDLDDQAPGQGPPPQPCDRIGQRVGMARKREGAADGHQCQYRDPHHEADQHRQHQRDHHDRQQQQIQLQPGHLEEGERQDTFDHALPGVRKIGGHDGVGEGVGQTDRLAHHRQRAGRRDDSQQQPREDLFEGVAGLDGFVAHDGDAAGGHEQHVDPDRDLQRGFPQPFDVGVLGDVGGRQQGVGQKLAERFHDLFDQCAEERGDRVHDHRGEVGEYVPARGGVLDTLAPLCLARRRRRTRLRLRGRRPRGL
ncbi:hypothetical protein K2224_01235 [Streptomyces sp. BHT-5-2]|uniref:hypothetical protein n=1 Tax=Streptomyces sp. BHT-5-2 TaxID=2866715 RepID=UPI001C8D846B|nr:hypothetical protein [Streptomyces sp. BHT-5-2]QZL02011.1 hypothetical protein K2224_01235 [Streptomyces sp. BHT-5-2]